MTIGSIQYAGVFMVPSSTVVVTSLGQYSTVGAIVSTVVIDKTLSNFLNKKTYYRSIIELCFSTPTFNSSGLVVEIS